MSKPPGVGRKRRGDQRPWGGFSPSRAMVFGFAVLILAGTVLLSLPIAAADGRSIGLIDAFFTATSASCVTGLVVLDTGTDFSLFGQLVILLLIQAGGLGTAIMTTAMAFLLGKRITLRERLVLKETLGSQGPSGVVRLTRGILVVTLLAEAVGTALLFIRFAMEYPPGQAAWYALFHTVSAFNNAGFDLFSVSLKGYATDPFVAPLIAVLFILGGIGFVVIHEVRREGLQWHRYSLHTRVVLATTAALLVAGSVVVGLLEWQNPATLGALSPAQRVVAAFFTAATPRTAGFEIIPTGAMLEATLVFTLILMFVGASPGGTGGGIKTTSFATLMLTLRAAVRGEDEVVVDRRHLPQDMVRKAWVISFIALMTIIGLTALLLVTEAGHSLTQVLFEVVSAFGTVGLSTGLTPDLSPVGRVVIAVLMYAGRVGPLTLAVALAERRRPRAEIQYPEERVIIG